RAQVCASGPRTPPAASGRPRAFKLDDHPAIAEQPIAAAIAATATAREGGLNPMGVDGPTAASPIERMTRAALARAPSSSHRFHDLAQPSTASENRHSFVGSVAARRRCGLWANPVYLWGAQAVAVGSETKDGPQPPIGALTSKARFGSRQPRGGVARTGAVHFPPSSSTVPFRRPAERERPARLSQGVAGR